MKPIRRALQFLLVACLLALPGQAFNAATDGVSTVNTLPRVALVIGNSRYKGAPLKNPANDAAAIAGQLKQMGFTVNLQLDAGRKQMLDAIQAFGASLARTKGVGLFYFAGHGAQLGWRNYLIPVDATVATVAEMQAQAVDVYQLVDDLIRARNPMNIIILDACRDSPFGTQVALEQKGLSQLDAPAGTLLAYATAPGNVAADGTGSNGLYTEFLLKEMQVRQAKIEDVFKRVRLNVRRSSNGQQIPWESTSLEEDFYFIPPQQGRQVAQEDLERQFEEELQLWIKIGASKDVAALDDYLRRYPSGKFSEVAQFRLDRLLAQQGEKPMQVAAVATALPPAVAPAPDVSSAPKSVVPPARVAGGPNPYTKGTARADTGFRIGDTYTYNRMDAGSSAQQSEFRETVTEITDTEVIYNRGRRITDLLGNDVLDRGGRQFSPSQIFIAEYSVGKKWTTRFHMIRASEQGGGGGGKGRRRAAAKHEREDDVEINFRVVGKESITVPAGTFDAYRVEGEGYLSNRGASWSYVYWIAPSQARRVVAMERHVRSPKGRTSASDRYELTSYRQNKD